MNETKRSKSNETRLLGMRALAILISILLLYFCGLLWPLIKLILMMLWLCAIAAAIYYCYQECFKSCRKIKPWDFRTRGTPFNTLVSLALSVFLYSLLQVIPTSQVALTEQLQPPATQQSNLGAEQPLSAVTGNSSVAADTAPQAATLDDGHISIENPVLFAGESRVESSISSRGPGSGTHLAIDMTNAFDVSPEVVFARIAQLEKGVEEQEKATEIAIQKDSILQECATARLHFEAKSDQYEYEGTSKAKDEFETTQEYKSRLHDWQAKRTTLKKEIDTLGAYLKSARAQQAAKALDAIGIPARLKVTAGYPYYEADTKTLECELEDSIYIDSKVSRKSTPLTLTVNWSLAGVKWKSPKLRYHINDVESARSIKQSLPKDLTGSMPNTIIIGEIVVRSQHGKWLSNDFKKNGQHHYVVDVLKIEDIEIKGIGSLKAIGVTWDAVE